MRIIKSSSDPELQFTCRKCHYVIGYFNYETKLEWVQNPFDEYDGDYVRILKCPFCSYENIMLKNSFSTKENKNENQNS